MTVYIVQFEDVGGLSVIGVFAKEADARQRILNLINNGGYQVTDDSGDHISATDEFDLPVWAFYEPMPVK